LVSLIDYVVVIGGWLFDDDTSVLLIFYTLVRFLTPEVMADGSSLSFIESSTSK
jgi:hypothetical protein